MGKCKRCHKKTNGRGIEICNTCKTSLITDDKQQTKLKEMLKDEKSGY